VREKSGFKIRGILRTEKANKKQEAIRKREKAIIKVIVFIYMSGFF